MFTILFTDVNNATIGMMVVEGESFAILRHAIELPHAQYHEAYLLVPVDGFVHLRWLDDSDHPVEDTIDSLQFHLELVNLAKD